MYTCLYKSYNTTTARSRSLVLVTPFKLCCAQSFTSDWKEVNPHIAIDVTTPPTIIITFLFYTTLTLFHYVSSDTVDDTVVGA